MQTTSTSEAIQFKISQERERLAKTWIYAQQLGVGTLGYDRHSWAVDELVDLAFHQPDTLWELILRILEIDRSDKTIAAIGAGPLEDLMKMVPGMSRALPAGAVDPKQMGRVEAIICSMTPEERARPQLIDGSRRKRIARGSGTQVQDVNQLLRQFEQMKKMMKTMGRMQKQKRKRLPF